MSEQQKQAGFFDGNPRTMFVFGVVTGMAAVLLLNSVFGLFGSSSALASNKDDSGTPTANPTPTAGAVTEKKLAEPVSDKDIVMGDLDKAKVVVVEYSDFECPFCQRHHPTLADVKEKYGDDVAWVYRHFPLTSIHPNAKPAAIASECAHEQGKFWEYADKLFENQDSLSEKLYLELATELGLNKSKFEKCLDSEDAAAKVDADMASGRASGVTGTPATFIGNTMVVSGSGNSVGAAPLSTFTALIDAAMK